MKRLLSLLLMLSILLSFLSCSKAESKPLPDNFYAYDNGILLNVDYVSYYSYPNTIFSPDDAYYYKNGSFHTLNACDVTIEIKSADTNTGENAVLPIRYFIYNDTVYPYLAMERKELPTTVTLQNIPNNKEEIIIYDSLVKEPLLYNLKTNSYKPFYEKENYKVIFRKMSDDGNYAIFLVYNDSDKVFIVKNLKNGSLDAIPTTHISDNLNYDITNIFFINEQIIYEEITYSNNYSNSASKWCCFDLNSEELKGYDDGEKLKGYKKINGHKYLLEKTDIENKDYSLYNLETKTFSNYSFGKTTNFDFRINQSGEYALCSYFTYGEVAGYDENGVPYYSNHTNDSQYKKILINLKTGKEIDIEIVEKHLKQKENYKDANILYQWISKDTLLVTYISGTAGNMLYINEVLNLNEIDEFV